MLHVDKAVIIGLIVNELSTNAIRHSGIKTDVTVTVKLKMETAKLAKLAISDDGKAKNKNPKKGNASSFGLSIVALMVSQIQGTMTTSPNNPFAYSILFKI